MSLEPSTWGHYLACLFFFSSYIFTCQLVVVVLLTLASCIGDTYLLTILAYINNYNPKLLVIIIIIIIIIKLNNANVYITKAREIMLHVDATIVNNEQPALK